MLNRSTPHFSLKILFLSLIFAFLTLGVILLKSDSGLKEQNPSEKLTLRIEGGTGVEIKAPLENAFKKAIAGQEIFSGTVLKTGRGQTAALQKAGNLMVLNENTQVRLLEQKISEFRPYYSEEPQLKFELITGTLGIKASEAIELNTKSSNTIFVHSAGVLTYDQSKTRLSVLSGDAHLALKKENEESLTDLIVPYRAQVDFTDAQVTNTLTSLKLSKVRKELKMTSLKEDFVEQKWLTDYERKPAGVTSTDLITSPLRYRAGLLTNSIGSFLNFLPQAKQTLISNQIGLKLGYILGTVEESDAASLTELVASVKIDLEEGGGENTQILLTKALVQANSNTPGNPEYRLKEFLIAQMQREQGPVLLRLYLEDLEQSLKGPNIAASEMIIKKWQDQWTEKLRVNFLEEYQRQVQRLQYTLLSNSKHISIGLLNVLDQAGNNRMKLERDQEEIRFEVAQERLQMISSLLTSYQYNLAKQYLKNSYLSLNMGASNPELASTQVFLTTGTLLAQRIDFAITSMKSAAQPIDETKFQQYLNAKRKEASLVDDLKVYLEVDEGESPDNMVSPLTPSEVKERFFEANILVDESEIQPLESDPFIFRIRNALLSGSRINPSELSFQSLYDPRTGTLTEVKTAEKKYSTPFLLKDFARFLNSQDSMLDSKSLQGSIDALLSDQEKMKAQGDSALARDLAIKFAVTQLSEAGIIVPNLKTNLEILDPDTMESVQVRNASIHTEGESILVNFIYNTPRRMVTDVRDQEGILIVEKISLDQMTSTIKEKIREQKKAEQTIQTFMAYTAKNQLQILRENISYAPDGNLTLKDLMLKPLNLAISGIYDPKLAQFVTVSSPLLASEAIELKAYFEALADLYIMDLLSQKQISVTTDQINTTYPFNLIQLKNVDIAGSTFDFTFDVPTVQPTRIIHLNTGVSLGAMSFQELKIYVAGLNS